MQSPHDKQYEIKMTLKLGQELLAVAHLMEMQERYCGLHKVGQDMGDGM